MIIQVDEEGKTAIHELANVVLKSLGLQAYNKVGMILNEIKVIASKEEEATKNAIENTEKPAKV